MIVRYQNLIALFAGILVSGCGADGVWGNAYESLKMAVKGAPELEIRRESVDQTSYAMITVRIGKLPGAILVLAEQKGGANYWMSSNNISVVTSSGRLIRTVGFDRDLNLIRIEGNDPLAGEPHHLEATVQYSGYMEILRPEPDNFSLRCRLEPGQAEQITIAELQFDTIHMVESCRTSAGWKFKNHYWVDPWDGFIWQSRQHFLKGVAPMIIRVLKPAA
jgi:hypothetical protein